MKEQEGPKKETEKGKKRKVKRVTIRVLQETGPLTFCWWERTMS